MKDELITFGTAKLAKEKGFEEPTLNYYNSRSVLCYEIKDSGGSEEEYCLDHEDFYENWNYKHNMGVRISAPTQSLLHRWLREKHKLYLHTYSVNGGNGVKWGCDVYNLGEGLGEDDDYTVYIWFDNLSKQNFCDTFEQALETGLQEALKLIK